MIEKPIQSTNRQQPILSRNTIRPLLMSLRDSFIVKYPSAFILLKNEFSEKEVVAYHINNGLPTIELSDGTFLSSHEDLDLPGFSRFNIPKTHISCILSYILRYKYPHFNPDPVIKTFPIPRRVFPGVLHRQHLNTFHDIPQGFSREMIQKFQLKNGEHVLELGAFIGFGTLTMARLVSDAGKVVSVEADRKAYLTLKQNLTMNNIKNVTPIHCAVNETDNKKTPIYKGGFQKNSILQGMIHKSDVDFIQSFTIQTLCRSYDLTPNFIVMTINGAEYKVIQSSLDYFDSLKPLRLIIPGWYQDQDGVIGYRIIDLLKSSGFEVYHTKNMHIFAIKS